MPLRHHDVIRTVQQGIGTWAGGLVQKTFVTVRSVVDPRVRVHLYGPSHDVYSACRFRDGSGAGARLLEHARGLQRVLPPGRATAVRSTCSTRAWRQAGRASAERVALPPGAPAIGRIARNASAVRHLPVGGPVGLHEALGAAGRHRTPRRRGAERGDRPELHRAHRSRRSAGRRRPLLRWGRPAHRLRRCTPCGSTPSKPPSTCERSSGDKDGSRRRSGTFGWRCRWAWAPERRSWWWGTGPSDRSSSSGRR